MSETFADHFSGHAANYSRYRPVYPEALFAWLEETAARHDLAWDVACGNGQAARGLAGRFGRVVGTDASPDQLRHAERRPGLHYAACLAETACLPGACVDLVTVAQALHWFDHEAFYREVRRVSRPGALLAAWCYELCSVSKGVDAVFLPFYETTVGPYWPGERRFIEQGYANLEFPFREIDCPVDLMLAHWPLERFLSYLRTWSAVKRYEDARGEDPVCSIEEELAAAWGDPAEVREVRFPLKVRAGIIEQEVW